MTEATNAAPSANAASDNRHDLETMLANPSIVKTLQNCESLDIMMPLFRCLLAAMFEAKKELAVQELTKPIDPPWTPGDNRSWAARSRAFTAG